LARLIGVVATAQTATALERDLDAMEGVVPSPPDPWSGSPTTLDAAFNVPAFASLSFLTAQFGDGDATVKFARRLEEAAESQDLLLLDPDTGAQSVVSRGAAREEILRLLDDAPEVSPS
jgi:hypothetical protein